MIRSAFAVLVSVAAVFGLGAGIASAAPVVDTTPSSITVQDDTVDLGVSVNWLNDLELGTFAGITLWTPQGVGSVGVFNGVPVGGFGPR